MKKELILAIEAAILAGKEILKYYSREEFDIELKNDSSPLTIADKKANDVINQYLEPVGIPVISEESESISYEVRQNWKSCWIVDPLDGTKEFLNKNGEFTVNIALIVKGKPQLGVIFAPALDLLYFASVEEKKAFKLKGALKISSSREIIKTAVEIFPQKSDGNYKVVGSRSHTNSDTEKLFEELKEKKSNLEILSIGSSLKFCMVAEGEASFYPRLGTTMEWDTAAGQAICEAVGVSCTSLETGRNMVYNRPDLRNSHFHVFYEG